MRNAWLADHVPGFSDLTIEEIETISEFVLLWGYFEAQLLNCRGSASAIDDLIKRLTVETIPHDNWFLTELDYMKNRYFLDGEPTHHFAHLRLRKNDYPDLVELVLSGQNRPCQDQILTLLIVVLRFRNNLFHGIKWEYRLAGQLGNFQVANSILRKVLTWAGKAGNTPKSMD
ncbi:hypothetical protein [Thalassospira sp. A3_1]|uniref:hypothetical protein n=1 Tax=Thalassospira sp. A3_1 TaxID=2821088 RepID=UPI001ADB7EC9|nr:hypothetical protein [Thalassospira sp. A3_1]MBO9508776.1 hypothetical protein [Thalassospira sp. A3_1]